MKKTQQEASLRSRGAQGPVTVLESVLTLVRAAQVRPWPAGRLERVCARLAASSPAPGSSRWERLARPDVVQALLRRAEKAAMHSPSEARAAADLALCAASATRASGLGGPRLAADLEAEAWSWVANAHRLSEDYAAAEATWQTAARCLEEGSGDPLVSADLAQRRSALLFDQGSLRRAKDLLRAAARCYQTVQDRHRLGRTRLKLGRTVWAQGELVESYSLSCQALADLEPERDPGLTLLALLHVTFSLNELGHPRTAYGLLGSAWPRFEALAPPMTLLRARWLWGRLQGETGALQAGERELELVLAELRRRELHLDAALCGLDLALLYARRGRPDSQRRLAEELLPTFERLGLRQEALAAFLVWADAARRYRATQAVVAGALEQLTGVRRFGATGEPVREGG